MDGRRSIDLNADVGEAADAEGIAVERELLTMVTSVNVACGGHAGDAHSMRATVAAAVARAVRVGAHPSYPDRTGFGRQPMDLAPGALAASLRHQLGALSDIAHQCGTSIHTVKAHGALYGEVALGGDAWAALVLAVRTSCPPGTLVVLPAGSPVVALADQAGLDVLEEGFCDRAYRPDGGLVDRRQAGSVYDDPAQAAHQAVGLAVDGRVALSGGQSLSLRVDTLCVHGDSPGAVDMARAVCRALEEAGIGRAAATASA